MSSVHRPDPKDGLIADSIKRFASILEKGSSAEIQVLSPSGEPATKVYSKTPFGFSTYTHYLLDGSGMGGPPQPVERLAGDLLYDVLSFHMVDLDDIFSSASTFKGCPMIFVWEDGRFDTKAATGSVFVGGMSEEEAQELNAKMEAEVEAAKKKNEEILAGIKAKIEGWRERHKAKGQDFSKEAIDRVVKTLLSKSKPE